MNFNTAICVITMLFCSVTFEGSYLYGGDDGEDRICWLSNNPKNPMKKSRDTRYDKGLGQSVATFLGDRSEPLIVDVHNGHSRNHQAEMFYRVGKVNLIDGEQFAITWLSNMENKNSGIKYDRGFNPSVAITDEGYVVEVHSGCCKSGGSWNLYYRIGKFYDTLFGGTCIMWSSNNKDNHEGIKFGRGRVASVAITTDSKVVVLYQKGDFEGGAIWYRIGEMIYTIENGFAIIWLSEEVQLDAGESPFITSMPDGRLLLGYVILPVTVSLGPKNTVAGAAMNAGMTILKGALSGWASEPAGYMAKFAVNVGLCVQTAQVVERNDHGKKTYALQIDSDSFSPRVYNDRCAYSLTTSPDGKTIVAVYQVDSLSSFSSKLYYKLGTQNKRGGKITWGSQVHFTNGCGPALSSVSRDGLFIQAHMGTGWEHLYYNTGCLYSNGDL